VNLRREDGPPLLIAHRGGAAGRAPENSLAALEAGLAAGADLIEFDVSPGLVVAHSPREAGAAPLSLDEALAFLGRHDVGLHVDVKERGYEAEVLGALRRHDVLGRSVISTAWAGSARAFHRLDPSVPCAIGYPRDRYGASSLPWPAGLTKLGAALLRAATPLRVPPLLRWARADTLSLHHTLCSPAAVAASHRRGAPVLAWTANDPETVRRLSAAGADAIVTDDPGMARLAIDALDKHAQPGDTGPGAPMGRGTPAHTSEPDDGAGSG
jgi:glycerophosphoryl diester phosphodiesterase